MIPRTKSDVIEALNARGLRLRQRDGQNFLVEPGLADAIVAEAGVTTRDHVIEIGPGAGALTLPLLHRAGKVTSVEIDRGLFEFLRDGLGPDPRLELVHGDALDGPEGLHPAIVAAIDGARAAGFERAIVVANLPYSAGTEIVIRLLSRPAPPAAISVMLQAEVVERLVAKAGTDAYGPLAVLVALTARVRVTRRVGPRAFFPQPDVDSVVVRLDPDPARRAAGDVRGALALARRSFLHRRKKLVRTLEDTTRTKHGRRDRPARDRPARDASGACEGVSAETIVRAGIDPGARPETLAPADWLRLAAAVTAARALADPADDANAAANAADNADDGPGAASPPA